MCKWLPANPLEIFLTPRCSSHLFRRISACPISKFLIRRSIGYLVNFIVFPLFASSVNGNFSEWTLWTPCSVTCGQGIMTRKRFCTNPPPTIGGKDCSDLGPEHEKTSCQLVDCRGKLWRNTLPHFSPLFFSDLRFVSLSSFSRPNDLAFLVLLFHQLTARAVLGPNGPIVLTRAEAAFRTARGTV